MSKFLFGLSLLILAFLLSGKSSFAHSGRTDSSGCHNCYTSYCYGEYHCHNGGYSPPAVIYTPQFPKMNASWTFSPNDNYTYDVEVTLDDLSPSQYSATMTKCLGCDPGPLVDFRSKLLNFYNKSPGTWYVNVRKDIGGTWSTIAYWTVEVPTWVAPTQTPTPFPTIIPTSALQERSDSMDNLGWILPAAGLGLGGYYLGKRK